MLRNRVRRRRFLKVATAWAGAAVWTGVSSRALGFRSPNQRPRIGAVGVGSRWDQRATGLTSTHGSAKEFPKYGDIVAVCDVDRVRCERAQALVKDWTGVAPDRLSNYRQVIDRDDIDIVHVSTPDHWHAKIAVEAMLAGKDVYCEKPMTLTIAEGRQMCDTCRKTGRIVQVGTQQRSDPKFLRAIAMIRDGRIGSVKKITCSLGGAPTSPVIPVAQPHEYFDWNEWLGPAPAVKFRSLAGPNGETQSWSRSHYEFRWWYEYSGGKLTDWGAHHVDIATWAMGKTATGPISVTPKHVKHPVPFQDGYPTLDNQYNTATEFNILAKFADGTELEIRHDLDNGLLIEGTTGRLFINRGRLSGKPVEELAERPLPDGALDEVYESPLSDHFRNFFEAVKTRRDPVSDVFSHHRALSTCHLAGIAARLGRPLEWDPDAERIVNDAQAQSFVAREYRQGFELEM